MERQITEAPVLLIIFNRPDTTQIVFDAIRRAKPAKLYVSADAPRSGNKEDKVNCEEARKIVKNVDWKCDVHYRFSDKNLGCGYGVSTAISWAFENEESLIILEDDCLPSLSFFSFCNYCLQKYSDDMRIWHINGRSHHQNTKFFENHDYIFSHYGHIWGWATWKRCWKYFDIKMQDFPDFIKNGGAINVLSTRKEGKYYNKRLMKFFKSKAFEKKTWDYQLMFAILKQGGLCIVPAKNLIENIGYIGTHSNKKNIYNTLKAASNFEIRKEPQFVIVQKDYEKLHFKNHIKRIFRSKPLYKKVLYTFYKKIVLKK